MTAPPSITEHRQPRIGPRPLGLHLGTAALSWTGAVAPGAVWYSCLTGSDPGEAMLAMAAAAEARFGRLVAGIKTYQNHPYTRTLAEPPAVWRSIGLRLLDYGVPGRTDAPPLLVIPSLINRHYILDLQPDHSLMRFLAAEGFRPFLVAWDDFGRAARFTTIDDCVGGKLEAALAMVQMITRQRPVIVGYCLGGTLAAGLASRRPSAIAGLVTLAAPWDFQAGCQGIGPAAAFAQVALEPVIEALGALPVDLVQTLFYTLDPFLVIEKFLRFAALDPASTAATDFVALEDWLNDGFPLPAPIARTLLGEWYGANTSAAGTWSVYGKRVDPAAVSAPALVVVSARDRIVPPESARALAQQLPSPDVMEVRNGHVGMVASRKARETVWQPLAAWLQSAVDRAGAG